MRGALVQLLLFHVDAGSLPADDESLAALSDLGSRWTENQAKVRAFFVQRPDGRLENPDLARTLRAARVKTKRRSDQASKAAKASWQSEKRHRVTAPSRTTAVQAQCISESSSSVSEETSSYPDTNSSSSTVVDDAVASLEKLCGKMFSDIERQKIRVAGGSKSREQLTEANARIVEEHLGGRINNLASYAATCYARQGPVATSRVDRTMRQNLEDARCFNAAGEPAEVAS